MKLTAVVPALPVRDVPVAVQAYVADFGFEALHQEAAFAVLARDEVRLHLWGADDDGWQLRSTGDLQESPSGPARRASWREPRAVVSKST